MRPLIYMLLIVTLTASVMQCGAVRTQANQIRVSRVRRLDEAEGN